MSQKPHEQIDVGTVMASRSLGGVMVSTQTQNGRDMDLIPVVGAILPLVITPMILVAVTMILYKLCAVWLLNLPCVCKVIVSIKRLTIPGGRV